MTKVKTLSSNLIRLAMSQLGSRPKTMSDKAIRQRKQAGKASGKARRKKGKPK